MADSLGHLTFGKFKDVDIEDIPDSYLIWVSGEGWFKTQQSKLCDNIKKELAYRDKFDLHIVEGE